MLTAEIKKGELVVSGSAAEALSQAVQVQIVSTQGITVTDDGTVGVDVPVSGSASGLTSVDLSGLERAGAYLYDYGYALSVTGTAQSDYMYLSSFADTVHGGSGNDTLLGNDGNDRIYGELGDDNLQGGAGNDRFQGSKGNDTIDGGDGDDIALYSGKFSDYRFEVVDGVYHLTDLRAQSPDGTDIIGNVEHLQFSDRLLDVAPAPTFLSTYLNDGSLTVIGSAASPNGQVEVDVSTVTGVKVLDDGVIKTDAYVDDQARSIHNVDLSQVQTAGAYLYDYGSALSVTGTAQSDYMYLGSLTDTVHGGSGNDTLLGNDGNDRLYGELGDDNLQGGAGNDRFQGSKGNDTIDGGDGDDIALYSGKSTDYHIAVVNGAYQIADLRHGTYDGVDTVANVEHLQFSDKVMDLAPSPTLLSAAVVDHDLVVSGSAAEALSQAVQVQIVSTQGITVTDDGTVGVDVPVSGSTSGLTSVDLSGLERAGAYLYDYGYALSVTGTAQSDYMYLSSFADTVHGGSGNDTLLGNDGNDRLYGELGDDNLQGGAGNDRFQDSKGNDTIDGGDGDDIALYSGKSTDYRVALVNGLYQITDLRHGTYDGTDTVANVEHLQFSDKTIDLHAAGANFHG